MFWAAYRNNCHAQEQKAAWEAPLLAFSVAGGKFCAYRAQTWGRTGSEKAAWEVSLVGFSIAGPTLSVYRAHSGSYGVGEVCMGGFTFSV